jgi:hypothetical protein
MTLGMTWPITFGMTWAGMLLLLCAVRPPCCCSLVGSSLSGMFQPAQQLLQPVSGSASARHTSLAHCVVRPHDPGVGLLCGLEVHSWLVLRHHSQ